jgi:signal transduction histidine kinase/CheY-like chemotaxis protein
MDNKNTLIQKLSMFIEDEKTLNEIAELFVSELESEIVKYNSSFKDYFFSKTICKGKDCTVKYSNTIFNVIGYFSEQIEGLPNKLSSIIHEEDRLRVENGLSEFFLNSKEKNYSISYRIIKENDDEVFLHETITVFRDEKGRVTESNSIFFDISEIEEKKKEIDDFSNEMINVNRKKDTFISIVSHDLKSPYTTLLGFSEILLNDATLSEEDRREYLEYIHKSSQHQLNFIEHLLDWSRLRTGRTTIEEQRLNLKNIISTVVSKFTGIAVRKNIEISQNIQKDIYIKSDEKQLSKAISDLLQNAINFSNSGSSIFIYGSRFKDGMIEIIVKDKGIGISEIEQENLFKLEHKHSREGTAGEQGSGMGLILVKEIMDKLRGDVWFYSKENEGSEFHITVPEAQNLILIIDDKIDRLKTREKDLSVAFPGYLILKAANGYAGLDYINEELPSVIIIKDKMPLLKGEEIVKTVRNKDKYFSVSVFVLSDEDVEEKYDPLVVEGIYDCNVETSTLIKAIKQGLK